MRRFNHLTALEHLLELDTTIFKEELYYPWYIQTGTVKTLSAIWLMLMTVVIPVLIVFTDIRPLIILIATAALSALLGILYFLTIQQLKKTAKSEALHQMMKLEKKEFMKYLEPFVPDDQKEVAHRISNHVDFSPKEYISVTVSTKSRVLHNTDSFIKDIERMFAEKELPPVIESDWQYSDTVFKVPESAKQNYERMKNSSTFNDKFTVPPEVRVAIIAKIKEALNRPALGRE
ncbi:hypothetical protein QCB45_05290 [Thiomicrorhabdus sp. ZW0627]|uniref:hypothetical protein n=1 Tax=Thiomicrorhabdus sp. ZW0627 TaxID=3039774 RepID=UPI0024368FDE|nr:hypothetical protein [Thiomicrorhabdus sp. ZW0627]MDG6773738.1 hypothetical protein [Thiomicrorhabdus sp. ZW0627]